MARLLRLRSLIAAMAVGALASIVGVSIGRAEPPPDLPPIAADELLATTLQALAERTPVSGEIQTHVDLGLPELPAGLGGGSMGPAGLLLGDQTFKYWRSDGGVRVAQILPFAERVVVANRSDAWAWDSDRFTAWHFAFDRPELPVPTPPFSDFLDFSRTLIESVQPYARVDTAPPASIAGREAYVVTLTPTSSETLVGRIELGIDAASRLPLRFQVFARGRADAVIEAGFASVDFGAIDREMYTFAPPPGATVKELPEPDDHSGGPARRGDVLVIGRGFDLIVAVWVEEVPRDLRPLLPYAGPLGSLALVDREDHAWLVGGAVPLDAVEAVASELP